MTYIYVYSVISFLVGYMTCVVNVTDMCNSARSFRVPEMRRSKKAKRFVHLMELWIGMAALLYGRELVLGLQEF